MAVRITDLVHKLLLPLRVGDTVFEEFTLTGAEFAAEDSRIVYTFAPSSLKIAVEPRSARLHVAQTRSFNITHTDQGPARLRPSESRLVNYVVELIRAKDPGGVVWKSDPTLFLVPGVLSHRFDLSVRAIDVLRRVPVIFVEPGKESITAELLTAHGIPLNGKRILPLPDDAADSTRLLEDLVAQDQDACLFGADEGLPGFNDAGKALLESAARLGDRLRVRTVAGPSALAMALLRIPINLDRFVFLGVLEEDPAGLVEDLICQGNDKPLILFLGADADAVARRIAAFCLPAGIEVFLACNLTFEDEKLFHLRAGDSPDSLPTLDPTTRIVLVVGPPPP